MALKTGLLIILGFGDYHQRGTISISSTNTPGVNVGTPASQPTPREDELIDPALVNDVKRPSSLCRWSIHYPYVRYQHIPSPSRSPPQNLDLNDEESWPTWPGSRDPKVFTEKLSDSLESNDFSNVRLDDLPIAENHVVKAARRSLNELLEEALGSNIMSRKMDLMVGCSKNLARASTSAGSTHFILLSVT